MNPDQPYVEALSGEIPSRLIFIMGCHRSGTTFLHNLLAGSGQFDFLSAYEVIGYPEILRNRAEGREDEAKRALQAELRAESGTDRGLDHIPVDVDLPEEYGFLLPGYDLFVPRLVADHLDVFITVLKKKRALAGKDRPLLLKEPNEFYGNLDGVVRLFPDAVYLLNHRHPLAVLQSHVTSWTSVYEQENPYLMKLNPAYRAIMNDPLQRMHHRLYMHTRDAIELILNHLLQGCLHAVKVMDALPSGVMTSFRYEDLVGQPERVVGELAGRLGIPVSALPLKTIQPRPRPVRPDVREVYEAHQDGFRPYLERFGYDGMAV